MIVDSSIDVFDLVKSNSNNIKEFIENINFILMKADGTTLAKELNSYLGEYCEEYGYCTCGEKLITEEYKESREYNGIPCEEVITEKYCPICH